MAEPPFQFRLRTLFLLTFAVAVLCVVMPVLFRGVDWFRRLSMEYWRMLLMFGAILAFHVFRVLMAFRKFRDSDL